ncbi:MAG: hypothetical protein ABL996_10905 [Micropepsaceae bacterium]
MGEQAAATASDSAFRVPTNGHEFAALGISLLAVFGLIQVGAPIIRELDFLDPKLRDYFIGISFAAFPAIHRGCKRGLAGFKAQAPVRQDLAPWFVVGVLAAALLFAWNQFVSLLGGLATGVALAQVQGANLDAPEVMQGVILGNLAISLPLSAVAAVFAGVQLNRYARSHVFAALALASVCFLAFNLTLNYFAQPEYVVEQINSAASGGALGLLQFFAGMALVGIVIFVFGCVGVLISHFNRERSIGRLIDAARRLPAGEREALAADIMGRLEAAALADAKIQLRATAAAEP